MSGTYRLRTTGLTWSSCFEVLEHLPEEVFSPVLREIERLAQSVLVSVPSKENLQLSSVKCPACGRLFHVYGHLRSFDEPKFRRLLHGFRAERVWKFGVISQSDLTMGDATQVGCGRLPKGEARACIAMSLPRDHSPGCTSEPWIGFSIFHPLLVQEALLIAGLFHQV
jgi:hypothetical protein